MAITKPSETLIHKTTHLMRDGMNARAFGDFDSPEALGDARWTDELILSTWYMAETGKVPDNMNFKTGKSGGGFDRLEFSYIAESSWLPHSDSIDTSLTLNRRGDDLSLIHISEPTRPY